MFDAARCGARFVHVPGIGALYRVTPDSLSRRSLSRFIADCALNAGEIEALWRAQGPLTQARREALVSMWTYVATSALINGLADFEPARRSYNRVAPPLVTLELAHVLRAVLGAARSARLVNAVRAWRSRALGRAQSMPS